MSAADQDLLFGRIALRVGMITQDQLVDALGQQSREGGQRSVGEILLDSGLLSTEQLHKIVAVQRASRGQQSAPPVDVPGIAVDPPGRSTTPPVTTTPTPTPTAPRGGGSGPSPRGGGDPVEALLRFAFERGASDVHLHGGAPTRIRLHGDFLEVPNVHLSQGDTERFLSGVLDDNLQAQLAGQGQVDFSHSLPGVARFRCNAYRQRSGTDLVLRIIPFEAPSLSALGLPLELARFANHHQGLVLLTGPAGCGKSTTLAALVRLVNEERKNHILTIEDPIEYLHPSRCCVVNQRQVDRHTKSFAQALRAALREDPDVIVIGELRDLETISLALTAAETGHLVLASLHTTNAVATINRLVGAFPPGQQPQIRAMVSESLRGVISQRLVKKADGSGRVAALEILVATTAVGNLIREQKTFQIRSLMQTGSAHGMRLLEASIKSLAEANVIDRREALRHTQNQQAAP